MFRNVPRDFWHGYILGATAGLAGSGPLTPAEKKNEWGIVLSLGAIACARHGTVGLGGFCAAYLMCKYIHPYSDNSPDLVRRPSGPP